MAPETDWFGDVAEALNRVLSNAGFPGVRQSGPPAQFADRPEARFTIQLDINTDQHEVPAHVWFFVTAVEVTVVRGTPNGLEKLIQDKIKHSSFTDANHGNVISTGIWNDGTVWRALSIRWSRVGVRHEPKAMGWS